MWFNNNRKKFLLQQLTSLEKEDLFWNTCFKGIHPENDPMGRAFARTCSAAYSKPANAYLSESWLKNPSRFDSQKIMRFASSRKSCVAGDNYGFGRGSSNTFGSCFVGIGNVACWFARFSIAFDKRTPFFI